MPRLAIQGACVALFGAAWLAACADEGETGGGGVGGCQAGEWRCNGTVSELCNDGVFVEALDCADSQQSCELDPGSGNDPAEPPRFDPAGIG
jgi:hypothetical protein